PPGSPIPGVRSANPRRPVARKPPPPCCAPPPNRPRALATTATAIRMPADRCERRREVPPRDPRERAGRSTRHAGPSRKWPNDLSRNWTLLVGRPTHTFDAMTTTETAPATTAHDDRPAIPVRLDF